MCPKRQDYISGVDLAKWECGSHSTESKSKTQTAFNREWGKIRAKQTKESWRNAHDIYQAIYSTL